MLIVESPQSFTAPQRKVSQTASRINSRCRRTLNHCNPLVAVIVIHARQRSKRSAEHRSAGADGFGSNEEILTAKPVGSVSMHPVGHHLTNCCERELTDKPQRKHSLNNVLAERSSSERCWGCTLVPCITCKIVSGAKSHRAQNRDRC